jgi:hypothetical protein
MIQAMRSLLLLAMLLVLLALVACRGGAQRSVEDGGGGYRVPGPPGAPGLPGNPGSPGLRPTTIPAPAATPAPSIQESGGGATTFSGPFDRDLGSLPSRLDFYMDRVPQGGYGITQETIDKIYQEDTATDEQIAAQVAQERIIVRTVDMNLVVSNIPEALDGISTLARQFGGWVVNSSRTFQHQALISIRVPANRLDEALQRLRGLAVEVESENSTSQDVTDEYVDNTSRLRSLRATEDALIKLLEKAEKVDEALNVQRELSRLQPEIESLAGRIKFLEETAAFSRVNVGLRLAPLKIPVDAGEGQTVSIGQPATFRASFKPPEGIEQFSFSWDFGDGTPEAFFAGSAATLEANTRLTSAVTHQYYDDKGSPFVARVKVRGEGKAGVVEGEDTVIVRVTRLPVIEVFPGVSRTVEEDEEAEFVGTFTRPQGLTNVRFRWDFGDGTPPATGELPEGVTRVEVTHVYTDQRPFPYTATLTIMAGSEAGPVEASSAISVLVTEARGWALGGWRADEQGKTAVRALSGVGQGIGTFLIWAAIFSPIWIAGGLIGLVAFRRARRR